MSNLDLRFQCDDLGRELSIREYLQELLTTLWDECEGFSGKRPFGNGGWENDLYIPLIRAGAIQGEIDEDGYLQHCDYAAGHREVRKLICEMFAA